MILMGVLQLTRWADGLMAGGGPPGTPVALVRWATRPNQQILVSTLERVADDVRQPGLTDAVMSVDPANAVDPRIPM